MDNKHQYLRFIADQLRRDVYARRVNKGGYQPVREKLSQLDLERHLDGTQPIGQYLVEGDKVRSAVFDLDAHDKETPWDEMVGIAQRTCGAAREFSLIAHPFRSGGGAGIHLWFFWETPQPARWVRVVMADILAAVGLESGDKGVAEGTVEIFPKQDRVSSGGLGNLVALPGARASLPLNIDTLAPIDWDTIDIIEATTRYSGNVPEIEEAVQSHAHTISLPDDDQEAKSALKHIPADDYHTWFRVMCALKQTFGDEGYAIFEEWSATCPDKFPGEAELKRRWDGLRPNGTISLGTLFFLAQERGWNGPSNPMVREMNARFGILTIGNSTQIIVKNGDRHPDDDFVALSKRTFLDRLAPESIIMPGEDGKEVRRSKADAWLKHPLAAHYHKLDFDPSRPPGHDGKTWNTWTGFGVEPASGDWSLLKDHIRANICQGNPKLYEWMINWMAAGVQLRGRPLGTAPVLMGMPGTGKGVLAHAYGRLWGSHYTAVTHPEHVIGRFSGHLMSRRFVFIDEGTFGGNRKDAGLLKTRITEPIMMFERKGIDPIRMRNRMIFMIASNEASVVPADKNDRRWMVLEVGDDRREDHAYFEAVHHQLNHGGYGAMLYELMTRDFSNGPDPRRTIKTEALFEQVLQAQGPELQYMHLVLESGRLPQNWVDGAMTSTVRAMQEDLRRRFPGTRFGSEVRLGRQLKKVFERITTHANGKFCVGTSDDGPLFERSTRYVFPPLHLARKQFEAYIGQAVPWDQQVSDWQLDPEPGGDEEGVEDVV